MTTMSGTIVSAGSETESHESSQQRRWQDEAAPFRSSSTRRGTIQLLTTLPALAVLLTAMYIGMAYSYWITLALMPLAAGFILRTFIIMHDCAHGSFMPSRRANEIIGFITGVLTVTPFAQWRRDHAMHHASSGDLDRRGHGDVLTLTVEEYLARDWWGRFKYRAFRNPFVMFGLGPIWLFLANRKRSEGTPAGTKPARSVHFTNLALLVLWLAVSLLFGVKALLLVYLPAFFVAASAGIWLFYVQHQFEGTYWESHDQWDYATAALRGSSYYRLPRVLEWISGRIGLHHVHHLDPKIPNYQLRQCHDAVAEFQKVPELTLLSSFKAVKLRLWDQQKGELVGFRALRKKRGQNGN